MDVENFKDRVTLIMTTFNNIDFTRSALWAFKRFYPEVRVVFADGGSDFEDLEDLRNLVGEVVVAYEKTSEECCNVASALVDTPYILFMDNDCKVIGPTALPLLVRELEEDAGVACTGAYAVKVVDWTRHVAYTGTVFTDHMRVDATARYFQLHRTEMFRRVGMFPTDEWFYRDQGEVFDPKAYPQGCQGDMVISRRYEAKGWWNITPRSTVPVIHWGAAKVTAQDGDRQREPERWYAAHTNHTRLDPKPLNEWEKHLG